jgi:hypothetical protein
MGTYQYPDTAYPAMEKPDVAYQASARDPDPKSVKEAMNSPHHAKWRAAMEKELGSLQQHQVYQLSPLPQGAKALQLMWLFKTKYDAAGEPAEFKARLVVLGQGQRMGVDFEESFAPVVQMPSLRGLLAYATDMGMEIDNMDVTTAFLQAPLQDEVYVRQPGGFVKLGPGGGCYDPCMD